MSRREIYFKLLFFLFSVLFVWFSLHSFVYAQKPESAIDELGRGIKADIDKQRGNRDVIKAQKLIIDRQNDIDEAKDQRDLHVGRANDPQAVDKIVEKIDQLQKDIDGLNKQGTPEAAKEAAEKIKAQTALREKTGLEPDVLSEVGRLNKKIKDAEKKKGEAENKLKGFKDAGMAGMSDKEKNDYEAKKAKERKERVDKYKEANKDTRKDAKDKKDKDKHASVPTSVQIEGADGENQGTVTTDCNRVATALGAIPATNVTVSFTPPRGFKDRGGDNANLRIIAINHVTGQVVGGGHVVVSGGGSGTCAFTLPVGGDTSSPVDLVLTTTTTTTTSDDGPATTTTTPSSGGMTVGAVVASVTRGTVTPPRVAGLGSDIVIDLIGNNTGGGTTTHGFTVGDTVSGTYQYDPATGRTDGAPTGSTPPTGGGVGGVLVASNDVTSNQTSDPPPPNVGGAIIDAVIKHVGGGRYDDDLISPPKSGSGTGVPPNIGAGSGSTTVPTDGDVPEPSLPPLPGLIDGGSSGRLTGGDAGGGGAGIDTGSSAGGGGGGYGSDGSGGYGAGTIPPPTTTTGRDGASSIPAGAGAAVGSGSATTTTVGGGVGTPTTTTKGPGTASDDTDAGDGTEASGGPDVNVSHPDPIPSDQDASIDVGMGPSGDALFAGYSFFAQQAKNAAPGALWPGAGGSGGDSGGPLVNIRDSGIGGQDKKCGTPTTELCI